MGVMQVIPPYPIFVDSSGAPLDSGYVYFGTANLNPETSPIQMFWDSALSIPVAQPVRTINGYLSRNGTPAAIYTSAQFSVTVRDKRGSIVYYSADSSGSPLSTLYDSDIGSIVQAYDALTAKLNLVQSWTANQTMVGSVLNEAQGSNIASASTINLTTATGNYVHITGTTTITAVTLAQGAERTIVFDGALTFTHGASLILPSAASITTAAGDTAKLRGEAAGVVRCVDYTRASGVAVVATTFSSAAENIAGTVENKAVDPLGIREAFNATGSAPVYACRAWVGFSGASAAGTYGRSGTTVTVTLTSHGMATGQVANMSFAAGTGGTATAGSYAVTVVDANTFTITDTASGTITGSPVATRNIFIRGSGNVSSITDNGTGDYTVNFATAMSDTNFAVVALTGPKGSNSESMTCFSYSASTARVQSHSGAAALGDTANNSVVIFR